MRDPYHVWQDDQIEMLKAEVARLIEELAESEAHKNNALERAERAEARLANLKEEIEDARIHAERRTFG